MFFKKRETEIDDDFEYDDFDDFDLDDAGFQDATPKSGPRKAVSEIAGGFFSGLKSSVLDPSFHRKVLKESLPDGYVSHYDDASTILGEAKSIYNTASEEARKIKEEYAKEIRPAVDNWNKKSNSKLSNKISNIIGEPQSTAGYSNTLSPEEAEYHNSANDIFGGVFAQSTSEGVNELTAQTREGNEVSKGLQQQTNTILTGVSNSLNQQNAFSEQVALKWKKKTLEIQFKQYFTARKQLEVQNQSLDYLKATIPNIVKNTALPDMVKVQTTELAGQMLAQKWIGGISDKAHESLAGAFGKIGTNIKQTIQDKSQLMLGSAGDVGSFFNMFNGEDEFTQTPVQMALNMIGGVGASQLVDTIFDKSKDTIRDKIDGTGLDYDKSNEAIKNLKLTLPALMTNLAQNGSGNDALDKLIEIAGIDSIYAPRSKTIQTAITGDALADQAVFNIETQKSITYTIPALLSEIHGELSSVRFAVGGTTPDDGDKLAMDWTSSKLNTRSRMKVNLGDRLYAKAEADKALEVVYKMLGKFGYDASKIRSEGQLLSEDGKTVLLSKKDLNNLAVAIKTASYDRTKFFNIESLAEGSELIRDVESRMNIARFFQQELNVDDPNEDLSGAINLIGDKKAYLERKSAEKLKQQNILEEARIDAARDGIPESQIRRAVQEGQVHDLVAQGIVTIDDQGNYKLDPQALAEQTMFTQHRDKPTADEMFGIKINNEYGILERDQQERERMRILEEREQQKREEEEKRKEAEKQKFDNMTASEKAAHIFKQGKANLKNTKEDILNVKDFIKGTGTTESAEQTAKQTFSEITDVLEEGAGVWAQQFKASVQDSAFAGPKKLPDNFSNLEFKPKQLTDLPSEEPPRRKMIDSGLKPQPEERRKGIKIGDFIYGADVKVTRGKRKPAEPPRRKIIDSGLKPEIDRLRRAKSQFSEEQASEIVSASSVVFTRLMDEAIKKQTQAPYVNPGFKPDANFYDGGTITKFSGLIQNFAEGGMVKINTFYNKLVDKLLKTDPVKSYPVFTPVADKPTGFDNVLAPIKTAMDKETAEGGDAQLIVASAGEEVLSTKNGDAQAFRDFKNSGVWAKMKTHKEIFEDFVDNNFLRPGMAVEDAADMWNYNEQLAHPTGPNGTNIYDDFSAHTFKPVNIPPEDKSVKELTKSLFSEVKRAAEESTEGLRSDFRSAMEDWRAASAEETDGKTIGSAFKNVLEEVAITKRKLTDKREFTYVEDPSQFDLLGGLAPNQGYQKSGLLNGIKTKAGKLKDIDSEESRAKMLGGLLGIKDFGVDKLRAFSSMFESETSELGGSAKPSFSFSSKGKGINTITHQLKELIRLTSYVALNTGSSLEDITPDDPELIEPLDGSRRTGPGFFSKLKEKFKRKPKEQTESENQIQNQTNHTDEENISFWSKLKSKFKRGSKEEEDEEELSPEEKERGLLRRAIGGLFGLGWKTTKFSGKTSWAITKGVGKGGWWGTKKTAGGLGWLGKSIFGATEETHDVYLEGERKPVMLAKDMAAGKYLSAEDGKPVLKAEDVKGAVLDEKGNFVITEEDWNNRRVVIFTNEGKRSLFVRGVTGLGKAGFGLMGISGKLTWNLAKLPYKIATYKFNDDFDVENPSLSGYIEKDIYVKGDNAPLIRANLIGKGVYWTKEREPIETYSQLKDGVYDNSGNLILGPTEIEKGLYTPDGTLISKALGFVGNTIGFGANAIGFGAKVGFGALKGLAKITGAGFSLMSGAAKGLWNALRGESKDFDIDGVDKYALMLQAQAASVDKLEMIRLLLDERIEAPQNKFNDKDGDGLRDGSYMDQIREKIAAKKKAKEDAKKAKEEKEKEKKDKEERQGMFSGLASSITSGISGFFSKGLMFAALGGLVAANFGPQIATGIFSGIRAVLPRWLGGYTAEKKEEIKANGGIIKHMMQSGAAAAEDSDGNRINTQPQLDEDGNPLPQELDENGNPIPTEGGTGLSSTTKFLMGAAAVTHGGKIMKGVGKVGLKGLGLLGKGIKWGANKTGLTAKLGLTGLGKKAAAKHLALKGGGLLKGGLKGMGGLLKGGVARGGIVHGARTAITAALPALSSNPIGWAVLGAVAVGVTVYAGYKLYKHLTKEDNHLATFRMAQYGYKMNNKKAVTKILDLEQYLAKYTIKATASTSAKISTQADTKKLFEIFGVNQNSKEESDRLLEWYYYRFKPVYLTWKTLFARAIGKVTIEDVDRLLFISDKLKMIDDADFHREELNPYDVPIAPFPGESEPDYTTREQVLEIRDKAISELGKINQEKHDAKVKSAGGGSKGTSDGVKPIDKMTASDTKSSTTKHKQKEEEKEREREAKEAARQGMGNNKPEQKEQSWFNKFLFGDKSKTDDTAFSWGAKLGKKFRESVGNFFGGSGGGGTYDASSKTLNLTSQDIEDLTKVTSTEAAAGLPAAEYNKQAAAIVDTIINRAVAKGQKFGKSIREVINAPRQFSKITGPKRLNPYGSVQNMPMSAVDKRAAAFVPQYIQARVAGQQPLVNGDLNYLNPHHSDESNLRAWGYDIVNQAKKSGQVFGKGQSIHYHGTTKDGQSAKPYGYKLALAGKVSAPQGNTGGSSGSAAKTNTNTTATAKPTPTQSATNPAPKKTTPPSTKNPVPANPTTPKNTNPPKDKTKKKEPATTGVVGWINEKSANIVGGVSKVASVIKDANKAMSGSPNSAPVTKKDGTTVNMTPQQKQAAIAKGEVPPAKPEGNHVAPQMTAVARPAKAAAYATKKARPKSLGLCAKYVRLALQHAGYPNMGGGIASAYMYATTGHLTKNGFKEIPANSAPQLGDVAVIDRNPKSKHGHICIYNGSKWVSDFIHPKPNVYSGVNPKIWLYRDAQFLNGAPAAIDGAFDTGADGTPLENGAPPGPPPYQMKVEKAREELEKRKARRAELLAKAQAKGYKEEKVKIGFEGGRARGEIKAAKADTSGTGKNKSISDKLGLPQFGKLGESKVITYDNTPSGYEPKVRESKIKEVEDNGAAGNSVGPKRDAETIRAEHAAKEAQQLEAAKNEQIRREKAEQQNQEQLKRLEARRQAEVVTANEQKIQIEKQNQIAATDSEIYKQQLDVQISMAKDIRRMAETLDKLYANPSQVLDNKSSTTITKAEPNKVPVEMNQHTRTVATEEPVSMKIR